MILSKNREATGNVVTIYAQPQFMKVGGVFRPINLKGVRLGEGFRVSAPGPDIAWIWIGPADAEAERELRAARTGYVEGPRFGHLVDTKKLISNTLRWRVQTSEKGVERLPGGKYRFTNIEEVDLGLSLADWQHMFGNRLIQDGDNFEMNLTELRADPKVGVINLDPTVSLEEESKRNYSYSAGGMGSLGASWGVVWNAASASGDTSTAEVLILQVDSSGYPTFIERSLFRFDELESYPDVITAIFKSFADANTTSGTKLCRPSNASIAHPFAGERTNYGAIKDAFGTLAALTYDGGGGIGERFWESGDLVAAGLYTPTDGILYYGIAHERDADNLNPNTDFDEDTTFDQGGITTITLTLPSTGGRRTILGAGF